MARTRKATVVKGKAGKAAKAKTTKSKAVKAKPAKAAKAKPKTKRGVVKGKAKEIELYYWPTPNGFKVSIMFEECRLPYKLMPVNISTGEQFKPEFLKISPNNRMPAIVDPDGPGGKPIAVFESGAILQYLGRKTGKFYPADERGRVEVDQWLFWQMGGLGPMAGQLNHFKSYSRETIPYAIKRYDDEVNRLYGVMNKRLADRDFLAGKFSIADMACVGWVNIWERQGQDINLFPHLKAWLERMKARPGVERGLKVGLELRKPVDMKDPAIQAVLFNQRAG